MTAEQNELIEKLNCLEFETSQLNQAYQRWRSDVEQGKAPDWMAAAIRITYDALIALCLEMVSPAALDRNRADEIERDAGSGETAPAGGALLPKDSVTGLSLRHGQSLPCDDAENDRPVRLTSMVEGSLALTPARQQNRIVGMLALADAPPAFSARRQVQLEADSCEIPCVMEAERAAAEPLPELLTLPELLPATEPDWCEPEMPVTISSTSTSLALAKQPAIQHEQEAEAEPIAVYSLATVRLPNWLQGPSTGRPLGTLSLAILATVAILVIAGGAIGIYLASPQHVLPRTDVPIAAVSAIPTGEKAEFKFNPDPVVAPLGSSFVVNAVLSRGSDVASVGVQIDYDASLLQFMGVSEGGLLVNGGRSFVLAQRNDPLTGVLKVSAEESSGNPGISGDGPVFALAFQARKKGKATVSIVPGAHDSQGRRIEVTGSQMSVTVK